MSSVKARQCTCALGPTLTLSLAALHLSHGDVRSHARVLPRLVGTAAPNTCNSSDGHTTSCKGMCIVYSVRRYSGGGTSIRCNSTVRVEYSIKFCMRIINQSINQSINQFVLLRINDIHTSHQKAVI